MDITKAQTYLDEYTKCCNQTYGRYRSWCWCYAKFREAFKKRKVTDKEKDALALNLGFYLASWGMYRGSSFVLQHDYKFLTPIVEILMNRKKHWSPLLGVSLSAFRTPGNSEGELLDELYEAIKTEFQNLTGRAETDRMSTTLITKILLGTLGCVPALDRFFEDTRKKECPRCSTSVMSEMMRTLADYWHDNQLSNVLAPDPELDGIVVGLQYPEAKILDMVFWHASYRIELAKNVLLKAIYVQNPANKRVLRRSSAQERAVRQVLGRGEAQYDSIYIEVFGGDEAFPKSALGNKKEEEQRRNDYRGDSNYSYYDAFLDEVATAIIEQGGEEDLGED